MPESADYILKISSGPSYDKSLLKQIDVNNETKPALVDGPNFCGYIGVRVLNYTGLTGAKNPESEYFKGIPSTLFLTPQVVIDDIP
jgi:hypothetical protein